MAEQIIIQANNFLNRSDLEDYIKAQYGTNPTKNKKVDVVIKGTKSELKKLHLSDQTVIWGIPCISSYGSTQATLKEKLQKAGKTWKE